MSMMRSLLADTAPLAPLWRADAVLTATKGAGPAGWSAYGVSIDSRSVEPGDLFIPLSGPRADGHAYIAKAFEAGAAACLASHAVGDAAGPVVRVDDCNMALVALGRAARARSPARVVAVTGSVGKTGVKDALHRCLSRQTATHASVKSYNNAIGVPLSLARMPADVGYGVFEIGMNHQGEIADLAPQIAPDVAIVTEITGAHQEFFASEEAIADAKAEIFAGVKPGGVAVLNRDSRHFDRLARAARAAGIERVIGFGVNEAADVRATEIALHHDLSCIAADIAGMKLMFKVGIAGRHWVQNALGVLGVVHALGADLSLAALALAELRPAPGRGQRSRISVRRGSALLIDESYNANPLSMRAALEVLAAMTPQGRGRRIAVLGDMAELGAAGPAAHAGLAAAVAAADPKFCVVVGPLMQHLADALVRQGRDCRSAADPDAALAMLGDALREDDVVLVKGSNASGMGGLADALKAGALRPMGGRG